MEERYEDDITIDIRELFALLWKKTPVILISMLAMALISYIGTKLFATPTYLLETKICVMTEKVGAENIQGKLSEDLFLDKTTMNPDIGVGWLVNECAELIKSERILEPVIKELDLDMTSQELQKMIETEVMRETRIITISVESENEEETKKIADSIRKISSEKFPEILEVKAVETIEEGIISENLYSSLIKKNTAIGVVLGLLFSVCIIVWLYIFDDKIKSTEDIKRYLGLDILGAVPYTSKKNNREAYRYIRTNVQFAAGLEKKVLTCANFAFNKKNDVALLLANSMAETGKRVLFVDIDMRKQGDEQEGLSQYLTGQAELKDIIKEGQGKNIAIMSSGVSASDSAELLDNIKFTELLKELRSRFDYIIIDTPAFTNAVDGLIAAAQSDASLIVIASKCINQKNAQNLKKQLEMSGCPLLGAVFCE